MLNILPYITLFVVFFLMANFDVLDIKLNRRSQNGMYIFALALMVLFAGCRWFNVPLNPTPGVWQIFDYSAYEYVYDNPLSLTNFAADFISADTYTKGMDVGYVYISSFFSHYIFSDANLFFLFLSLITVVIFAKGLNRNHIHYGIFIVLFVFLSRLYFQYNFIMIRQAIAMAIAWWAIPFAIERRFWKFFLFCIIGGIFHFTAFLFVIVYFLPKFKFSNKFLIYLLPILLLLGISGLTDKVMLFGMEKVLEMMGLGDKVVAYIGNEMYSKGINPLNFLEIVPFLYFAVKYREDICSTKHGHFFFNMFIFYVIFMLLTMNIMALTRISSYYLYSCLFIINFVFSRVMIYGNRVIYGYLFMLYFFVYGVRFIYANFSSLGYKMFIFN